MSDPSAPSIAPPLPTLDSEAPMRPNEERAGKAMPNLRWKRHIDAVTGEETRCLQQLWHAKRAIRGRDAIEEYLVWRDVPVVDVPA